MNCKKCGSNKGFYSKISGTQYYDEFGNDVGWEVDSEKNVVYCVHCDTRTTLSAIRKDKENSCNK